MRRERYARTKQLILLNEFVILLPRAWRNVASGVLARNVQGAQRVIGLADLEARLSKEFL
jgi:hypothetical protein